MPAKVISDMYVDIFPIDFFLSDRSHRQRVRLCKTQNNDVFANSAKFRPIGKNRGHDKIKGWIVGRRLIYFLDTLIDH